MEIFFKIIGTCIIAWICVASLCWLWTQQIDIRESVFRAFKFMSLQKSEWVATRDPNIIYQNSASVGNVSGKIEPQNGKVIFREICDTSLLNRAMPFEYRRDKFKIIGIRQTIGLFSSVSPSGTQVKHNVIIDVVCEKIK
jgi:hypothetical protein